MLSNYWECWDYSVNIKSKIPNFSTVPPKHITSTPTPSQPGACVISPACLVVVCTCASLLPNPETTSVSSWGVNIEHDGPGFNSFPPPPLCFSPYKRQEGEKISLKSHNYVCASPAAATAEIVCRSTRHVALHHQSILAGVARELCQDEAWGDMGVRSKKCQFSADIVPIWSLQAGRWH